MLSWGGPLPRSQYYQSIKGYYQHFWKPCANTVGNHVDKFHSPSFDKPWELHVLENASTWNSKEDNFLVCTWRRSFYMKWVPTGHSYTWCYILWLTWAWPYKKSPTPPNKQTIQNQKKRKDYLLCQFHSEKQTSGNFFHLNWHRTSHPHEMLKWDDLCIEFKAHLVSEDIQSSWEIRDRGSLEPLLKGMVFLLVGRWR